MQSFHRGHPFAALGYLDTVAEQDKFAVEPQQEAFAAGNDHSGPQCAEWIELDCTTMEAIQQSVVALLFQSERTNDAGNPQQVLSHRHSHNAEGEPKERACAGECRSDLRKHAPPLKP